MRARPNPCPTGVGAPSLCWKPFLNPGNANGFQPGLNDGVLRGGRGRGGENTSLRLALRDPSDLDAATGIPVPSDLGSEREPKSRRSIQNNKAIKTLLTHKVITGNRFVTCSTEVLALTSNP